MLVVLYTSLHVLCYLNSTSPSANMHDLSEQILLGGDIESNPGPSDNSRDLATRPDERMPGNTLLGLDSIEHQQLTNMNAKLDWQLGSAETLIHKMFQTFESEMRKTLLESEEKCRQHCTHLTEWKRSPSRSRRSEIICQ